MDPKIELETIYQDHHKSRNRYGYLFCHGKRAPYLQKWIGQGKTVLDLGCRDGELTKYFLKGNDIKGVDIDRNALKLIQKKLQIKTLWLDLNTEWPFKKESYDVIITCEILEHLFFLDKILPQIQKTLKKDGFFLGSVPNAFRIRNRFKFLLGKNFETDPTHVHMFSIKSLLTLLNRYFKDVEIVPVQGKILPFLPISDKTPPKLGRLFSRDLLWKARPK